MIINDTWRNYTLRKSGVLTNSDFKKETYVNNPTKHFELTDWKNYSRPIIALRSNDAESRCAFSYVGFLGRWPSLYAWHNLNVNRVEYFIFDDWQPPTTSKYGLRVRNGAGQVVFSSDWYPLKAIDMISMTSSQPPWGGATTFGSAHASKKLACVNLNHRMRIYNTVGGASQFMAEAQWFSSVNTLSVSWMYLWEEEILQDFPGAPGTPPAPMPSGSYPLTGRSLLVDVTNYPVPFSY
ncbi:MAG: hypothetical protein LBG11_02290 [Bifidobacteriaceae bacterium]|nr:hypothetical protein [Bifidobacteriaceae bacterium]